MSFKVYLAGSLAQRAAAEVTAERRKVIRLFRGKGVTVLDPWRTERDDAETTIPIKFDYVTMKRYISKDHYAIDKADVMLILTGDHPTDGTWCELGRAYYKCQIPIVMIAPKRVSEGIMGFSNIYASAMFATAEEAVDFIVDNYVHDKGDK